MTTTMYKNCGMFFIGGLPQFFATLPTSTTADAAEFLDQTWVCGRFQYPGGCSPNYSYYFAWRALLQEYPDLNKAQPWPVGYPFCVYNAGQDEDLRVGNTSGVSNQ